MKYGFVLPGGGARKVADVAARAEGAGWDGFFVCDAPWWIDPWVSLAAAAMTTERIRLGTMLTAVARRRPWKLAAETATLDNLSAGRLILSVGLGVPETGLDAFNEVIDRRIRAELTDEGLDVLVGLWGGQPFEYEGRHYKIKPVTTFPEPPKPVQQPRIPIWVVGAKDRPKSMRRVLKWDGLIPTTIDPNDGARQSTPDEVREMKAFVDGERTASTPFDIVVEGETTDTAAAYAEAGATWWNLAPWSADERTALRRLEQGPPTL